MRKLGKLVGTILALILAVTVTAGPVYAETARTTVTLAAADSACTLNAVTASGTNFGTLTWDPTAQTYVAPTGGLASINLSATITKIPNGNNGTVNCGITVSTGGTIFDVFQPGALTLAAGTTEQPLVMLSATTPQPFFTTIQTKGSATVSRTLQLDPTKINNTAANGTYSATLSFTANNGL